MSDSTSNNRKLGCLILLLALSAIVLVYWSRVGPTRGVTPVMAHEEEVSRKTKGAGESAGRALAQNIKPGTRDDAALLKEANAAADRSGFTGNDRPLFVQGFIAGFRAEKK